VDGSGKTTHARSLMIYLDQSGYRCKLVWGGYRLIFSYAFFAFTRSLGYWKKVKQDAYTNPLEFAPERVSKKLGTLLTLLIFVDFQIRTSLKIRLPMLLRKLVICDRYFYDVLMELERSNMLSERFTRILSRTTPKPLIAFLIDAPETLTSKRRGFSREELSSKKRIYLKIAKNLGLVVIDSSREFSENQNRIRTLSLARIRP
jgi:thymidylate kinase